MSLLRLSVARREALDTVTLQSAAAVARDLLSLDTLLRGSPTDPPSPECSLLLPLRVLAEEMEEAGALHLAADTLESLLATSLLSALETGRVLAQRARIAWKSGELDRAEVLYRSVGGLARTTRSSELRVRTLIGRAVLAQLRGNTPDVYRWAQSALDSAERRGYNRLASLARNSLMVAEAKAGRFEFALHHGWQIYRGVVGDQAAESAILGNLGQLLLDMDMAEAAHDAFAALFVRSASPRVIVPALGGFALASAASGAHADLAWAAREVLRATTAGGPPYDTAIALLETATALAHAGSDADAAAMRAAAADIADRHGYHEVSYRVRAVPRPQPVAHLPAPTPVTAVAREIHRLLPRQLPRSVLVPQAAS